MENKDLEKRIQKAISEYEEIMLHNSIALHTYLFFFETINKEEWLNLFNLITQNNILMTDYDSIKKLIISKIKENNIAE
jgi:hypothetical protein